MHHASEILSHTGTNIRYGPAAGGESSPARNINRALMISEEDCSADQYNPEQKTENTHLRGVGGEKSGARRRRHHGGRRPLENGRGREPQLTGQNAQRHRTHRPDLDDGGVGGKLELGFAPLSLSLLLLTMDVGKESGSSSCLSPVRFRSRPGIRVDHNFHTKVLEKTHVCWNTRSLLVEEL